jgi:ABC-type cobalamin/Fe3+-siderophores transport system ATPase subunit
MIDATGLMVFYENMLALNNVSIKCSENQIVGVFGANSAGKSTLMYMLSGIIEDIRKKEDMALSCARNGVESLKNARFWKTCALVATWLPLLRLKRPWIMYSRFFQPWKSFKKELVDF